MALWNNIIRRNDAGWSNMALWRNIIRRNDAGWSEEAPWRNRIENPLLWNVTNLL